MSESLEMSQAIWIMHTEDGCWYPVQPSVRCKPEDHGNLNPHVVRISDFGGKILWERVKQ